MMTMMRSLLIALVVLSFGMAVSACGMWRGGNDVETNPSGEGAMGKGPGLFTGKSGGIVIYQR